jgi:pimeloyl-ACP methyl ester carboxylesterase
MPELRLDDVTLNYEVDDFTDPWLKPQVVFLHHGCGRHMGYWYRWVPNLAQKYTVVRIDARGFGKSSEPGPNYKWSIKGFAKDVIALLDRLKISKVNFVGEFMGSWTGIQLALDYPERIKNLVLGGPPYFSQNSNTTA